MLMENKMFKINSLRMFLLAIFILFGGYFSSAQEPKQTMQVQNLPYTPVITPNGSTMPWILDKDGAKV